MDGKVKGYNVGGDFWLRVPVSSTVVLPFVVSAEYRTIKRDGSGIDIEYAEYLLTYDHVTRNLFVTLGGGVDITPAKGTKLAAGIYYSYFLTKHNTYNDYDDLTSTTYYIDTYSDMPKQTEHRLTLKALAEKELSPVVALRGGFSAFYGYVKSDYAYTADSNSGPFPLVDVSNSGYSLGVNASVGATFKLNKVALEPFINGGYVMYKLDGDGAFDTDLVKTEIDKANWLVGGGLSVRF